MELKGPIKAKEPTTLKGHTQGKLKFSATAESRIAVDII